jgi:hypothetical protein
MIKKLPKDVSVLGREGLRRARTLVTSAFLSSFAAGPH